MTSSIHSGSDHGGSLHTDPGPGSSHGAEAQGGSGASSPTESEASFLNYYMTAGEGNEHPTPEAENAHGMTGIPLQTMPHNQPQPSPALNDHAPATETTGGGQQSGGEPEVVPPNTSQHGAQTATGVQEEGSPAGGENFVQRHPLPLGMAGVTLESVPQHNGEHGASPAGTGADGQTAPAGHGNLHQGADPEAQHTVLANPSFATRHPTIAWGSGIGATLLAAGGGWAGFINTKTHGG